LAEEEFLEKIYDQEKEGILTRQVCWGRTTLKHDSFGGVGFFFLQKKKKRWWRFC
jgi:hypothetical protein